MVAHLPRSAHADYRASYDLVATAVYRDDLHGSESLGLKFGGSKQFDRVSIATFDRLERRLAASGAGLADVVAEVVARVIEHWPEQAAMLVSDPVLRDVVNTSITTYSRSLLGSPRRE